MTTFNDLKSEYHYTNVWLSNGEQYQSETKICHSIEEAEADYFQNLGVWDDYSHTKVYEVISPAAQEISGRKNGTQRWAWYGEINIKDIVEGREEKEPDSFNESDSDLKREEEAGIC